MKAWQSLSDRVGRLKPRSILRKAARDIGKFVIYLIGASDLFKLRLTPSEVRYATPIAFCIFGFGLGTIAFLFERVRLEKKYRVRKKKRVALLSVTRATKGFYNDLIEQLDSEVRKIEDYQVDLTIRAAYRSYLFLTPAMLRELGENFDCLMVIADDPDVKELLRMRKNSKKPIIILDVYVKNTKYENSTVHEILGEKGIGFVGGDELAGGRCASSIAADHLEELARQRELPPDDKFNILIILGRETEWELQRVEAFRSDLNDYPVLRDRINFIYTNSCHYEQEKAFQELNRLSRNDGLVNIDLVFACNDAMAAGAINFLAAYELTPDTRLASAKVVGYDGSDLHEMGIGDRDRQRWFLGSVDVHIGEQAQSARALLEDMLKADEESGKTWKDKERRASDYQHLCQSPILVTPHRSDVLGN
jgi:DNA-binding LacI/PurR family transcriptional regulator